MSGTGDGKRSKAERCGYLGLGMMGIPMARRLVDAGFEVAVWNRSAGKAKTLVEAGTSPWLDLLHRSLVTEGELARLIAENSLRGETSNPSIFEKAILGSDEYDDQLAELSEKESDAQAIYDTWRSRGAHFLTPPQNRGGEIRCYLRDPDGYLIEVGQTIRQ